MQAMRAPTEVPAEALDARPESRFNPVQALAFVGGVILVFQLYVWGKWITGPYFTPVPPGPSLPPLWMRTVLTVCEDMSETRRLSQELQFQANHDSLTGLVNRREFERRFQRILESARSQGAQHAVCYVCLLYTSPSPRDGLLSRMPSSA